MLSETELMIADGVAKNGWYLVNYVPAAGNPDPSEIFSYTVGLTKTAGWPELIVFGLDETRSFAIMADLIEACWEKKQRPVPGMTAQGIVQDLPIKLVPFDKIEPRYFHFADWFARHVNMRPPLRLQLLWSDREGRLPDDPSCDPAVRAKQRMAPAA